MATKAGLIAAVNGFITSVVNITKHRNSMLEIINELFATTTNYTVSTGIDCFHYSLNFKKIGNVVYVDGYAKSQYTYTIYDPTFFVVPNGIYSPKRTATTTGNSDIFSTQLIVLDVSGIMFVRGAFYPEVVTYINFNYTVND